VLTAFAILTDGLVYAAYLFLVAAGLSLIFGVMKILNVTARLVLRVRRLRLSDRGRHLFRPRLPAAGGFLLMILVAMAIGLVLGLVLERGLLRLVYGKDEIVVVLVTYAAFLILEDVIRLIWGAKFLRALSAARGGRDHRRRRARAVGLRHRPRCARRALARSAQALRSSTHDGAACSRW
jgi:branched-subunit amino acid ABC-type transport system permease component